MTFEQYLELVYLDKLYSRKEFLDNKLNIIKDFELLSDTSEKPFIYLSDDLIHNFCNSRKMTSNELFDKFSKSMPVKLRNFLDLTGGEESRRFSDCDYPTIRAFAVTGRSWVVFISPKDGTLTYF